MEPFTTYTGIAAPLDRVNVDTDAIIPKQFLKKIERTGFGKHLFHELRYTDYEGTKENPEFVLNQLRFRKSTVLATRDNFGCGSSREHAPWALADYGFRVIIAPSFADIFYNNCVKNGILLAALKSKEVDEIFTYIKNTPDAKISADLPGQTITAGNKKYSFPINAFAKECLLKGLDGIGWTLQFSDNISAYEGKIATQRPWMIRK